MAYWIVFGLSLMFVVFTAIPLIRKTNWWIRIADFPRFQISVILIVLLLAYLIVFNAGIIWHYIPILSILWAIVFQLSKMHPYTGWNKPQVKRTKNKVAGTNVSLLVANVLAPNRRSDKLVQLITKYQPDLFLTLESNEWWGKQMEKLEKKYPHTVKKPLDNLYGMHLYSKLKLIDPEIKFTVQNDIPSIHTQVKLSDGSIIKLHCLHPRPPSPSESDTSLYRDAELLILGKQLKKNNENAIVAGDLNDVAWSRTSWLFRKVSGLLDPRIGRGFYNTYNAKYPLLRFPLDHVFHSDDFTLNKLKRLSYFGSDHFPLFISLSYNRKAQDRMKEPSADGDEKERANEKISRL